MDGKGSWRDNVYIERAHQALSDRTPWSVYQEAQMKAA